MLPQIKSSENVVNILKKLLEGTISRTSSCYQTGKELKKMWKSQKKIGIKNNGQQKNVKKQRGANSEAALSAPASKWISVLPISCLSYSCTSAWRNNGALHTCSSRLEGCTWKEQIRMTATHVGQNDTARQFIMQKKIQIAAPGNCYQIFSKKTENLFGTWLNWLTPCLFPLRWKQQFTAA